MIKTENLPITAQQGATFEFQFQMYQNDRSTLLNMSGWSASMMVRQNGYADQDASEVLSLVGSIDVDTGTVSFSADASTMAGISPSVDDLRMLGVSANDWPKYAYDVELETADGVIYKPYRGQFAVVPEVTR